MTPEGGLTILMIYEGMTGELRGCDLYCTVGLEMMIQNGSTGGIG